MSRLQTLRMIACMLLMGVVAIAAYLFYQHSLYFCLFFSLMIMAGIIIYICQCTLQIYTPHFYVI